MNRQDTHKGRGIEWTQPYGRPGYTWNPVKGCLHACEWQMPDGAIAECYAKSVAERVASHAYPNGFAHVRFDEKELHAPLALKDPAGIFSDSMSDLLGKGVKDEWVERVLDVMRQTPQHIYMILTKNPPRLKNFRWPENAWVGVSAPPTFMYGNRLSLEQQQRWYSRALSALGKVDVPVRWTSIEPLSWDVSPLIQKYWGSLDWAVIGAASNGRQTFQPDELIFKRVYRAMGGLPVFLKGNISRTLAFRVCERWVEEYPMVLSDWRATRVQAS